MREENFSVCWRTDRLLGVLRVLLLVSCFLWGTTEAFGANRVVVSSIKGSIGIAMEQHLEEVLSKAKLQEASLLVIELDTPGGLVTSMRGMVQNILNAPFPVVVWVAPKGARAASAGAFLVQAAHVAAMSEGTTMGAAHPVMASGRDVESKELNRKITNDLAAQMRSLAGERDRNAELAAKMVTESLSLTAKEALEAGVVDVVTSDLETLLASVDGRIVIVQGKDRQILLRDVEVTELPVSESLRLLELISRPDVAYLLLLGGLLAVVFEVLSPGGFVLGVSGAVMVLLGAFGLRMLPFNWAGIVLLLAGIAVLVTDVLVGGVGILSVFGAAALLVGGLVLFRAPGGELMRFSYEMMVGAVLALAVFFVLAAWLVVRSLRKRATSGKEGLVGAAGDVVQALLPEGMIRCHGEFWRARTESGENLSVGSRVEVVRAEGLTLVVRTVSKEEKKEEDRS